MKWSNIRLIFQREIRDQLRDRRTVFTIAVLPIMLYPLLGISLLQVAQFRKEHPTQVWVVGAEKLNDLTTRLNNESTAELPPLIEQETDEDNKRYSFSAAYCSANQQELLEIDATRQPSPEVQAALDHLVLSATDGAATPESLTEDREIIEQVLSDTGLDCLLYVVPSENDSATAGNVEQPRYLLLANSARDKSTIASQRVEQILASFKESLVNAKLADEEVPAEVTRPFSLVTRDIAAEESKRAAVWSKILPFVMLIWALTGAFYPAIDVCAGEKERGTLETLLSSPAKRTEIVYGKLLTIMVFSISTAVLNLASMAITGTLFIAQIGAMDLPGSLSIGPPPVLAMVWLLLAMIPVSALFSALSLAIAAFARSSKEGQYYLMPLLLITLPLMLLPVLPTAELDLGTSLIPVTGMLLLLRSLIEGQFSEALRYALPVLAVTLGCCLFAVRWAVDQFNNESVLFRASERLGLGLWLRHMVRDRGLTPSIGEAFLCGFVILLAKFFGSLIAGQLPGNWNEFVVATVIGLVAFVATPTLLMAIMLTRRPAHSLLLTLPTPERMRDRIGWWLMLPGAALLAISLHPAIGFLSSFVIELYPVSEELIALDQKIGELVDMAPGLWAVLAVFALTPAICEELAFRGFMLSGLYSPGRKWRAVLITAAFFGATHGILQQSIVAAFTGLILGYVAVQTKSVLPCMIYHFTHNALPFLYRPLSPETIESQPLLDWLFDVTVSSDGSAINQVSPVATTLFVLVGIVLLGAISRLRINFATPKPEPDAQDSTDSPNGNSSQLAESESDNATSGKVIASGSTPTP